MSNQRNRNKMWNHRLVGTLLSCQGKPRDVTKPATRPRDLTFCIRLSRHQPGRPHLLGDRFQSHRGILGLTAREAMDDLFPVLSL